MLRRSRTCATRSAPATTRGRPRRATARSRARLVSRARRRPSDPLAVGEEPAALCPARLRSKQGRAGGADQRPLVRTTTARAGLGALLTRATPQDVVGDLDERVRGQAQSGEPPAGRLRVLDRGVATA